jgi:two-component system NtrC family sensor kinase
MRIFKSIRFKLLFLALVVVFSVISLLVWSDVKDTEARIIESQKEKVLLLSDTIQHSLMLLMLENRWNELQIMIDSYVAHNAELKEVRIFNPENGKIFISAERSEIGKEINKEEWEKLKNSDNTEKPVLIKRGEEIFATRLSAIKNMPPCYGCHPKGKTELGAMNVSVSLFSAQQSIRESRYKHLLGLAVSCVLIALIFWISGDRLINKPLIEMVNVMKKVEQRDLSVRLKEIRRDEFGYLSHSFNNMITSLEESKKELEEFHLQQMEKASKLASLGEIISSIAHEIKNPLTGIFCAVQLLYAEMNEGDSRKPIVSEILNQINRLDRFVKDLLSYAKPVPLQFVSSQVKEVLKVALFFVHSEAKKQHVVINTFFEEDLPLVLMDPSQMQQVFLNIIINAIQSMPKGGVLTISVTAKDCREASRNVKKLMKEDKCLIVSFEDKGSGISREDIEHIFEPFYSNKAKGTGLGLPITQKIIHNHGGEIFVDSEPGKGSIFTICLPVTTSEQDAATRTGGTKGENAEL